MGSKKYRGKLCAYGCGRMATTADHVFAREFFLPGTVYTPIKVPACIACNNEKSQLEHYLTTLLPFGGRHANAAENLQEMVPKRLARNVSLHRMLERHQGTTWTQGDGGLLVPTMTLPIDGAKVDELHRYLAKGLAFHHWNVRLTDSEFVVARALNGRGVQMFEQKFFRVRVKTRVFADVGQGTFIYEGVQGVDNPVITAWRIAIYGGVQLGGDATAPGENSTIFGMFSGPRHVLRRAELVARFAP
jgi:hypothetical protein